MADKGYDPDTDRLLALIEERKATNLEIGKLRARGFVCRHRLKTF